MFGRRRSKKITTAYCNGSHLTHTWGEEDRMNTTTKHQIKVDGALVSAFYATKETALQRVEIARKAGHDAEYAGTVEVPLPAFLHR